LFRKAVFNASVQFLRVGCSDTAGILLHMTVNTASSCHWTPTS